MKVSGVMVLAAVFSVLACSSRNERTVFADFLEAPGVKTGDPVLFRGVQIGEVREVQVRRGSVRVTLSLRRREALVRTTDRVEIIPVGVFGDAAVRIVVGSDSGAAIQDGAVLTGVPPVPPKALSTEDLDSAAAQLRRVLEPIIDTTAATSRAEGKPKY